MNKNELVRAVARKSNQPIPVVDEVLASFIDLVALNLVVCEDVHIRGFGKFVPREHPGAILTNSTTGEVHHTGKRQTVSFLPSMTLKKRLNERPFLTGAEQEQAIKDLRSYLFGRASLDVQKLQELLWRRAGPSHRIAIELQRLAEELGISYDKLNKTIVKMRKEGRIRHVGFNRSPVKIYEIANPFEWDARDETTHARHTVRWG